MGQVPDTEKQAVPFETLAQITFPVPIQLTQFVAPEKSSCPTDIEAKIIKVKKAACFNINNYYHLDFYYLIYTSASQKNVTNLILEFCFILFDS